MTTKRRRLTAVRSDHRYPPPIYAHVGENDPKAGIEEVRVWFEHTTGPIEVRTHPGGHFYLSTPDSTVVAFLPA